MKRIIIQEDACMGCGLCEVYCVVQHSTSKDLLKAYKKERPRPISRVRVEEAIPLSFAVQCQHCEDPPCVEACLSGAMQLDADTRLVVHDTEKCMGCWTCIAVCPYGALRMDADAKVVVKCDLCPTLDTPACVANCPNEALVYKEVCF
ncbi:4Fe-4S ferredoxin [miscellaneous Crenarchaeota group archaeon SMTZ1-55]|nr:MAG: 4Fe-4S ferredoxin [miscellaneous Crenarchaeota group archaeon SMTZ1-55]